MIEQVPDEFDFVETYFRRQARRKLAWFLSKAKVWLYLGFAFGVFFGGIAWLLFR
jgi:hypothetical protein